ncbi:MAG: hypothetical protein AABY84_07160 [Candidatus Firestonebacteria bacterium]
MEEASNIFFLGCGFHEENMERLKIDNCENKEFASTCYKLSEKIQRKYKENTTTLKIYLVKVLNFIKVL